MKLYFYKRSIPPAEYDYYNHSKGIVGYSEPINQPELFEGTVDELDAYLNDNKLMTNHIRSFRNFARR